MTYLRLAVITIVLLGVFLFGVWLTQPSFPINRKFVAISLNGVPFVPAGMRTLPTFEVARHSLFSFGAGGFTGCNHWSATIVLTGTRWIILRRMFTTAVACAGLAEIEGQFGRALINATRWRTEGRVLILENDTDVLRFILAPR